MYFTDNCYSLYQFGLHILWPFGIYFPTLECCAEKNLATRVRVVKSKKVFFDNGMNGNRLFMKQTMTI
jgi:hypothetical protein